MNSLKTFLYSFTRSLFKPKYYKNIVKASFWFSFKYLWFLLFILVFIKSILFGMTYLKNRPRIHPSINKFVNYASSFYPKNLELKITKGKLYTNVKEPYVINLKELGNRHLLIIDTKGLIDDYPVYNTYVLATRNAVVYPSESRNNKIQETKVFYFNSLKNDLTIDKSLYDGLFNKIEPYISKAPVFLDYLVFAGLILFLLFGSFFALIGVMIDLALLTFFVWIFNKIVKMNYNYSTLYRLGMHAVTWPIIIVELIKYLKLPINHAYVIIFFLWMVIVLFSLKKTKSPSKK